MITPKSTYRDLAAANPEFTETQILNAGNPSKVPPTEGDSTVIGGGIHGLIYAVHARLRHADADLKINVFEKSPKPQWKIGESTLPHFAQWTKSAGLLPEYLLRLFGLHNGLEFHVLDRENQGQYKEFCNNGPPPFLAPGYQLQRAISELMLTVYAQRNGINVWHGHAADVQKTTLGNEGDVIPIKNMADKSEFITKSPLLVDGTGRFRQYSSKVARVKRFPGWNTDAFFSYFTCNDEAALPKELKHFESGHTNHICFPEGWMYLIRLLSWEDSPIPNMMDMLHYLFDLSAAGTPNDEIPSTYELAEMFGCRVKWVWSIGFACRDDVKYPADMSMYGTHEGERRFNFIVSKYEKLKSVMALFDLVPNWVGPGQTWVIRKQLTYQTEVVSGPGWVTIGDGIGFTNPLLSPGINVGMASTTFAAELTRDAVRNIKTEEERIAHWKPYDTYCANAVPSLWRMNKFLYLSFLHPSLAPRVALLWQITIGHALPRWSLPLKAFKVGLDEYAEFATHWVWGSQVDDYVKIANKVIELLDPRPLDEPVPQEIVDEIIAYSDAMKQEAVACGKYQGFPFRYEGEFRNHGPDLTYDEEKYETQDAFENQCSACGTWHTLRGDWHKCYTCGVMRPQEECEIKWNPPLEDSELMMLAMVAPSPESVGKSLVEYVARKKMEAESMSKMDEMNSSLPAAMAATTISAH